MREMRYCPGCDKDYTAEWGHNPFCKICGQPTAKVEFERTTLKPAEVRDIVDQVFDAAVGMKFDAGKLRYDLIPPESLEQIAKVLTGGAAKYAPDNWKHVSDLYARYYSAAMRHMEARRMGEVDDPESGLPHAAHAACCLLFLLWHDVKR